MKTCSACKQQKPLAEFNKKSSRSDGLQPICKDCNKERLREYYRRNPEKTKARTSNRRRLLAKRFQEYKALQKCRLCPENDPCCVEFHHIEDKDFDLGAAVNLGFSWERIMEEVVKCVPLCSNCHRKVHAGRLSVGRV